MKWQGVFPAITTPFRPDLSVDHGFLKTHIERLVSAGCTGLVPLGSLGEAATLETSEKLAILETCARALDGRAPLVPGIAALSTEQAVGLARSAAAAGAAGIMVLPPWVYRGDWRETEAHFRAVIDATDLPCMLYNNPIAYGTDVVPEQIELLFRSNGNLAAVKESSGDVRRITAIRERLGDRLAVFVGVDDLILEGIAAGAVGWIAGLVDALPEESLQLFEHAISGRWEEARKLYEWFLPLLRLDTVPKFVQLIKLVQAQVGLGSETVRPPRLALRGDERETALAIVAERLSSRPGARARP